MSTLVKFTAPKNTPHTTPVLVNAVYFAAAFPFEYRADGFGQNFGSKIILTSGEMVTVAEDTDTVWDMIDDALLPTYTELEVPDSEERDTPAGQEPQ